MRTSWRSPAAGIHEVGWVGSWRGDAGAFPFQPPPVEPCMRFSRTRLTDPLHRRCSTRARPGPVGPGCGDDSIEGDQPERVTRSVDLDEAPGTRTLMTFRQEQREPHHRVVAGLVERLSGVPVSEVPRQPRKNRFSSCTTSVLGQWCSRPRPNAHHLDPVVVCRVSTVPIAERSAEHLTATPWPSCSSRRPIVRRTPRLAPKARPVSDRRAGRDSVVLLSRQ